MRRKDRGMGEAWRKEEKLRHTEVTRSESAWMGLHCLQPRNEFLGSIWLGLGGDVHSHHAYHWASVYGTKRKLGAWGWG